MNGEKPLLHVKRSKINEVFEYCLDNGIAFNVQERAMGIDEFEITMEIENIKKAIQLGYFLKENRLELVGANGNEAKTVVRKTAVKKTTEVPVENPLLAKPEVKLEPKHETKVESNSIPLDEPKTSPVIEPNNDSVSLSFDLN